MARCFPYTRVARDPVAEAMAPLEPAADKLQKEWKILQKKEKKEMKEEKKRQKKAAQSGEKYEIPDHQSKHGHKRKHEGQNIVAPETRKALNDTLEQLEKSGLSEEHEAPSCSQALHGTPESSLETNKRLKATVSSSPSQARNGVICVKLPSTNQRIDPESTAVSLAKPRVLGQQSVKQLGSNPSMAKRQSSFQHHINTVTVAKQLVFPEQNMALRNCNQLGESRQVNQQQPAMVMQRVDMMLKVNPQPTPQVIQRANTVTRESSLSTPMVTQRVNLVPGVSPQSTPKKMERANMAPRVCPQLTQKVTKRFDPSPTKVLQKVQTAPVKVMQRAEQLMPTKVLKRETRLPANLLRKPANPTAPFGQPSVELPAPLHKPNIFVEPPSLLHKPKISVEVPVAVVKQQQQQVDAPTKEEPCYVETSTAAAQVKEVQQSRSDRKSQKKAEKKERKFADLFVTWKPSPILMEDTNNMDVNDQDWLFSCGATPKIDCRAFDGSVRCQPTEQRFSLQPRAVHLPELHMYQLPYVVPF